MVDVRSPIESDVDAELRSRTPDTPVWSPVVSATPIDPKTHQLEEDSVTDDEYMAL